MSHDHLINNVQYPNQIISFDKKGNILKDSSNYYNINMKDTILLEKLTLGHINLEPQISRNTDFHMVYFWSQDANGNKTKIDSTYGKNEKEAEFWLIPKTIGKHTLNGHILEENIAIKKNKQDTTLAGVIYRTKKIFFKKEYYVIDTINN